MLRHQHIRFVYVCENCLLVFMYLACVCCLRACLLQAVSTVYKTVAWHHYIIVECVDATYKVELLRDGVRVQGILGDEAGEGDKARERRRRQLTHTMPEQEHPDAGEEVKHIDFTGCGTTVEPLKAWMAEHLQEPYHLLEWNCQHFCDVVIALFRSCKTHS